MKKINQDKVEKSVREICNNWWITLRINDYELSESLKKKETNVSCEIFFSHRKKKKVCIEGSGKGLVDALYCSTIETLANDYPTLNDIKFEKFLIKAVDLKKKQREAESNGSDADVIALLKVKNSYGETFEFESQSFSATAASIKVVLKTIEFFVNSHIAVLKIYKALKDAKERNRSDLIQVYTMKLSELVKVTCYTETMRKE